MAIARSWPDGFAWSLVVCHRQIRVRTVGSASTSDEKRLSLDISYTDESTLPEPQHGRSKRSSAVRNDTQAQETTRTINLGMHSSV